MTNRTSKIVNISPRPATLKRKIRSHLRVLGFRKTKDGFLYVADGSKDSIRLLHASQRNDRLETNRRFISERAAGLLRHFATGKDVNPARISPVIERISAGTWQSDLFRLASLTWSVPVSQGFGRRLRYLVWDKQNEKLIGLIAIGDPVFNLSVRDNLIEWDSNARRDRLVNVMDAYVLGALPPYSMLLGGKMVACLIRSRELYDDFAQKYGATTGVISRKKKKIPAPCRNHFIFHGPFVRLQQAQTGRRGVFQLDRLHGRMGPFSHSRQFICRTSQLSARNKPSLRGYVPLRRWSELAAARDSGRFERTGFQKLAASPRNSTGSFFLFNGFQRGRASSDWKRPPRYFIASQQSRGGPEGG